MSESKTLEEEFLGLYDAESKALSNYCRALCNDDMAAEDLMGETILIAFESFTKLNDKQKFKYYLFGIASRLFKKMLRRKKLASFLPISQAKNVSNYEQSDSQAALSILYDALKTIKPIQAEIIVLKEISGFTIKEIAEIHSLNENTVKTHLTRAKQKLKQLLESDFEIDGKIKNELKTVKSFNTNTVIL